MLQLAFCEGLGHAAIEEAAEIVQQIALHGDEEEGGRQVHEGKVELGFRPPRARTSSREGESEREGRSNGGEEKRKKDSESWKSSA